MEPSEQLQELDCEEGLDGVPVTLDVPLVNDGWRKHLSSLAGTLRKGNQSYEQIYRALQALNNTATIALLDEELQGIAKRVSQHDPAILSEDGKPPLEAISADLGFQVTEVIRRGIKNCTYEIKSSNGRTVIMSPQELLSFGKAQVAIVDAMNTRMPDYSRKEWLGVVDKVMHCAREVPTSTDEEETIMVIKNFAQRFIRLPIPSDEDELKESNYVMAAIRNHYTVAFLLPEGRIGLHLATFHSYLRLIKIHWSWKETATRLSRLGFVQDRAYLNTAKGRSALRYWASPPNWHDRVHLVVEA